MGLDHVRVHGLVLEGKSAQVTPTKLPDGAGLLYPSEDAQDLSTLAEGDRPSHLVVIDGTWTQAHRLFRDNAWIAALPRYRLPEGEGSRYRIRTEPRLECLSTLESVVVALRILQPDLQDTKTLLSAFEAMIDDQIEASTHRSADTLRVRVHRRQPRPVPAVLLAPDARIVVVYTEASPRLNKVAKNRTPLRISAVTLDGTRVFDRLVRRTPAPDAYLTERMGLEPSAMDAAMPRDEVLAAFQEFCQASPDGPPLVLAAWNAKTFRWFEQSMSHITCISLKGVWANISRVRVPGISTLVKSLALTPSDLSVTGRAGRRLSNAHAMARHIARRAAPLDVRVERIERDRILGLRASVLGGHGSGRTAFSGDMAATTRHWAATVDGMVVGCVSVMLLRGHALRGMAVAEEYQRRGVGARLLGVVCAEVDEPMWCNARVQAVSFYVHMGWVQVGPVFDLQGKGGHQRLVWAKT